MAAINPLLYDDTSESEVMATPGAKVIAPPELHGFQGLGSAVATTLENSAVAVWNSAKDDVAQNLSNGDAKIYRDLKEDSTFTPTKFTEIDPLTTGTAAKIAAPLIADGAVLLAGGGNPFLAGAIAGQREAGMSEQNMIAQGVDADTAKMIGQEKGVETLAAFSLTGIPFAGRFAQITSRALRWGAKAGTGAAVTTGMDWAGGETRAAILERHGYTEQAEQMRHWDAWRIGGDLAGGTLLGLTTRAPISSEAQLSGAIIRQADDAMHESAPGIPTTPDASAATFQAVKKAWDDAMSGQPINVEGVPGIHDADFLVYEQALDLPKAQKLVAKHEKLLKNVEAEREDTKQFIENARRDGYHDEADHFESNVLPVRDSVVAFYNRMLDDAKDDVHRLQNKSGSRFAFELEEQLTDHQADRQAGRDMAEAMKPKEEVVTPAAAAQADEAAKVDVVTEAQQLVEAAKSPVQRAIEQTAAEAEPGAPKAAPVKLTPEQQEMVNMHNELRQLADATGDHELHAELDEAMRVHQAEHMEAGKYNVAALCAIGL